MDPILTMATLVLVSSGVSEFGEDSNGRLVRFEERAVLQPVPQDYQ